MSQQNDNGLKRVEADGAIAQFARVIIESDGKCVAAGLTQIGDGIAQNEAFAAGDEVTVKLWSAPGTFKMIAEEALAVAADLYTAASGKMQDTATSTSFKFAKALEAATADGDIVECVLLHGVDSTAVA